MFNKYYGSTSESSDSDVPPADKLVKTMDLNYLMLDSHSIQKHLEDVCVHSRPETIDTILLNHNTIVALPQIIDRFQHLRVLDISNNRITSIPEFIVRLPLHTLIAKNNLIDDEGIPKTFESQLKVLNISGNRLIHFPDQILMISSLEYLYMGSNHLVEIPKDIDRLIRLKFLCLGGNNLSDVPVTLGQLDNMKALNLSHNSLESLPQSIANLKNLKSLMLHKNRLRTLPVEIVSLKCLSELSLRDNPLVVRFVSDMTHNPPTLLELSARIIKINNVPYGERDLPHSLIEYLSSAHHCVNPKCKGVFFDDRVEHIKFVDFCGKYRIPLLQYLCSSKCIVNNSNVCDDSTDSKMMRKVLLG
ncbi:leucine-rich repeat-containing protein 58 [Daktulosphaira vitifoliae]|uniref:leucine-rich repeat-containing protein 58 n=1 Tax=Daktulosphaira vitifoliae TaxID=58002 RepID=UPI0021AA1511|nr:leucine-rich repeat-containing protein 58 [Daktulosphaira vitifoliae]